TVADVLAAGHGTLPHVRPEHTVRDAIRLLRESGAQQLPVLAAEPPVVLGEVLGAVHEGRLLEQVLAGDAAMTDAIGTLIGAPLDLVGAGQSIASARAAFGDGDTLLVADGGNPCGLLTRADLLDYLSN
ncbi:MAG TPA: CBS domain-containing protein, partial [Gaiellaceae bacterium]|nr:CBS domain-containing protein [Gaiellaceae bacterium]